MSGPVLDAAHELTGFDARRVETGSGVLIVGTEGVGVRTLADACSGLAADLEICPRTPGPTRPGVGLVVIDPSSSVGQEERLLVERMRSQVGTVALVCTKIDAFWEWPRIVRTHRATLDPFATLPLFGVSAAAALGGAVDESGVDALVEWIREALDAPADLRAERARVSAGAGAVEHLLGDGTGPESDATGSGATDAGAADALLAERRALVSARDRGRLDRLAAVRAGLSRARSQSSAELHAGVRELAGAATDHARDTDADHRAWLTAGWADLADRVRRAADDRIDHVRDSALVGLEAEQAPPEAWADVPLNRHRSGARPRRGGAEDALLVIIGASTGLGVGRLIVAPMASVQTLQWISMPLTLMLGVAVAAWVIRVRRGALNRSERVSRTVELLGEARATLDHRLGLRIASAETRIAGQIARAYERRARRTSEGVARLDDEIRRLRSGSGAQESRRRRDRAEAIRRELVARSERLWAEVDDPGGNEQQTEQGRNESRGRTATDHDDGNQ
ncbi:hypothetical protein GDN83_10850 [Gordonia jinghuaiqii]|uniref:Uncharacterized protein n=1 Tax=Gordonia jinghuaiqii TaxID=2758710 RepID=A0A7D7R263_9ACTN|nr:hypothetical protein [Gordonia jinghuaiqii]MCR5978221.1 hypothetical protein [Gordonia jinghuaiqii]QMT01327.1 hypothetical protein H1R19_21280 [Gordonia jinghuaiqii]